jgi:aldehyde dehydrogenase (NAD+)
MESSVLDVAKRGLVIGDARPMGVEPFSHRNPSTGEVQAEVLLADEAAIDLAVKAASEAGPAWAAVPADQRGRALHTLADLVLANTEEFAKLQALEIGTPVAGGAGAAYLSSIWVRYYAGWADKIDGSVTSSYPLPGFQYSLPEPFGVIGIIVPWNGAVVSLGMKAAPAIAAGNAVVVKPPEFAPFSSLRFAELALEAGIPPGVINVVPGRADAGAALVRHAGVHKVSFTGGAAAGRAVMELAARGLKPVVLELGGKSANLVFPDANLDRAADMAVQMSLVTLSGQGCVLPTRLYVHNAVYSEMIDRIEVATKALAVGDPFDPQSVVGPVVNEAACDRILGMIETAKSTKARVIAGGNRLDRPGYFVEPTVFADVDHASQLAQQEVFGPVLATLPFADEDEAVRKANDTTYGLGAYLHTQDVDRVQRLTRQLKAGSVYVNGFSGMSPAGPFGGYKQSGFGREGGRPGIDEFLQIKNVFIAS